MEQRPHWECSNRDFEWGEEFPALGMNGEKSALAQPAAIYGRLPETPPAALQSNRPGRRGNGTVPSLHYWSPNPSGVQSISNKTHPNGDHLPYVHSQDPLVLTTRQM